MTRAPLRFLLTVLVLWAGARAAILLPDWTGEMIMAPAAEATEAPATGAPPSLPGPLAAAPDETFLSAAFVAGEKPWPKVPVRSAATSAFGQAATTPIRQLAFFLRADMRLPVQPGTKRGQAFGVPFPPVDRTGSRHWSASAWLLIRDSDDPALAPGGTLGGSQAGARLNYALGGTVSLSGRFYLPLRHSSGTEFAAGIDWRPVPSLPISLLAERRERLGRDGRNAFALTAYGGGSRTLTPHVRLDAYGQAGIVGLGSRDLFADGALRISRRIGPIEVGAGAWGAAQPGAARLDVGPSLSWRLPVPRSNLRLQADWRFRIAGDAAPGSGPALTLAADF